MKVCNMKVVRNGNSITEETAVFCEFQERRVSGSLTFFVMARPAYLRYSGDITINGVEYRAGSSIETEKVTVESYALSRKDYGKTSIIAMTSFQPVLALLAERVRLIPAFQAEQKKCAIQHLGYDISRATSEITLLQAKIEEEQAKIEQAQEMILDYEREDIIVEKSSGLALYAL